MELVGKPLGLLFDVLLGLAQGCTRGNQFRRSGCAPLVARLIVAGRVTGHRVAGNARRQRGQSQWRVQTGILINCVAPTGLNTEIEPLSNPPRRMPSPVRAVCRVANHLVVETGERRYGNHG